MINILFIGLNELSKDIIKYIENKHNIYGFDFDMDKNFNFYEKKLILNNTFKKNDDFIKITDILILNIEFPKYKNILEFIPFLKSNVIIVDTNSYKLNVEYINDFFSLKQNNFVPCNFLLFPNEVIINYDSKTNMKSIQKVSEFFKTLNFQTSALEIEKNNVIFSKLYQVSFIIQKVIFKDKNIYFLPENIFAYEEIFFNDILLNKEQIIKYLEQIVEFISLILTKNDLRELIKVDYIGGVKTRQAFYIIDENIALKIFIEKVIIKIFMKNDYEDYINSNILIFNYKNYTEKQIIEYFTNNKDFITNIIIFREKIKNIISLLKIEDVNYEKFKKYLVKFF